MLPVGYQIVGLAWQGAVILIYEAPADILGLVDCQFNIVDIGETFEAECTGGYAHIGTVQDKIVYQTWNF